MINQEEGKTSDIINLYNLVYLKTMKPYIYLYKDRAKEIRQNTMQKAMTPGLPLNSLAKNVAILTPTGTKPFIKAFCPQTPLIDNYPSEKLSMKTIFQKGQMSESQVVELNHTTLQNIRGGNNGVYKPMHTPN